MVARTKKTTTATPKKKGKRGRPPAAATPVLRGAPFKVKTLEVVVRQLAKGHTLASVARAKNFAYPALRTALMRAGLPTSPGAAIIAAEGVSETVPDTGPETEEPAALQPQEMQQEGSVV